MARARGWGEGVRTFLTGYTRSNAPPQYRAGRHPPYGCGSKLNPSDRFRIDDTATGLTYMQARYYDPVIGRFLSIDPVNFSPGRPDMFNRYAYVANDPLNMVDPDGRQEMPAGLIVQLHCKADTDTCDERARTIQHHQSMGYLQSIPIALMAVVPDPSDLLAVAAIGRLKTLYSATKPLPRPTRGLGSRRGGNSNNLFRELENNTAKSNQEFANDIFDNLAKGLKVTTRRDGTRSVKIGRGTSRTVTVRQSKDGGITISVHVGRSGSRLRTKQEIKIRVKKPK